MHSSFILSGKREKDVGTVKPFPLVYASIRNGNRHLQRYIPLPAS